MNSDKYRGSFDNIGFVYSSKIGNQTALRYVNFGFNYHKAKSFNRDFAMSGNLNNLSQTDQMAVLSRGLNQNDMNLDYLGVNSANAGWLSILGWNGCLIHPSPTTTNQYIGFPANDPSGSYSSRERGGIDAYDFNLSFNISNRVYLGFTLGAYDVNYTKNTYYEESFSSSTNPDYFLENTDYAYSLENFM